MLVGSLHRADHDVQTTSVRPNHDAVARVRVRLAMVVMVGALFAPPVVYAGSINLAWDASSSAVAGYVVYYGTSSGVYSGSADAGNQLTFTVNGLTNGVRYYFVVKAYSISSTAGIFSGPSNEVNGLVPGSLFTDDPLTPGVHAMRAVHIIELRTRINALRATYGLPAAVWTDATLGSGSTTIKAIHFTEMRSALNAVYAARARTPPTYTDLTLVAGSTLIKAAHIAELRAAVLAVS